MTWPTRTAFEREFALGRILYRLRARPERLRRRNTARALLERFFELQVATQPDLFVEAGAFAAVTSRKVRELLPECRVVAFEASPRNFQHFIAETDFSAHGIEYLNLAVSDAPGELIFRAFERHKECISQRGSILSNLETEDIADAVVPAVSLDGFFADSMPRKPSILIDVEGASRQVLVGAQELLRRAVSVYIEVEDETRWQGQWLTPDVIRFLETFGLREIGRDCQYGRQYNILFARS